MLWVTRQTIRINRSATAFQDRDGARGFDAPGATYPHCDERGRCSFEALVDEHCARDPALVELARIVHGADFADAINDTPESAGLRAIAHGFPLVSRDDHDTLERATFLYDALYAHLRARRGDAP
ncbi:MAG: chromate resistance protein [Deltaproteobacteria bacterium]|nr:MAG: chromate resistance protein [Deltaproteobacteria bacterium]